MMEIQNTPITFIGTGRLAHSVVPYLIKNKYTIAEVLGRTEPEARIFAKKFRIKAAGKFNGTISKESRAVFIAVNDESIKPAAQKISSLSRNLKGKIFIHFSGSLGSDVLDTLQKKGALTGSFHIMQTFPSGRIINIRNAHCGIETENETLLFSLFNFARQLKLRPFRIASDAKPFYHLAGVFASNFLNSHFYNSKKIFSLSGIEAVSFSDLFQGILDQTYRNIKSAGNRSAVSGPVVRNDITTIKNHIAALKKKKEWLLLAGYLTESLSLAELLSDNSDQYRKLKKYLVSELKLNVKRIPAL